MAHVLMETDDWRFAFDRARMITLLWSDRPPYQASQRAKLAYAMALGKPIRLLALGDTRFPEDLCVGYADLKTACGLTQEALGPQVMQWLAELDEEA